MKNRKSISIRKIRNILYFVLLVSIGGLSLSLEILVDTIVTNFGSAVESNLHWKVSTGARELGKSTGLALVSGDTPTVLEQFEAYRDDPDVQAFIAISSDGTLVASYGDVALSLEQLFSGHAGDIQSTSKYIYSWQNSELKGREVGKVCLVISTKRIIESTRILTTINYATAATSIIALVFGFLVLGFFTTLIIKRDEKLSEYASTLEEKVNERTAELDNRNMGMRLVLDNVQEGFITFNVYDGKMEEERSAVVDYWIPIPYDDMLIWDYIARIDPRGAEWLYLGVEQLWDNIMPVDIVLSQLPARFYAREKILSAEYIPIRDENEKIYQILLVLRDITGKIENQRMEAEQREALEIFQRIAKDRAGFINFIAETRQMVHSLIYDEAMTPCMRKRIIHTVKGNSAFFGLSTVAKTCHEIEDLLEESSEAWDTETQNVLNEMWSLVEQRVKLLIGDEQKENIELSKSEYNFFYDLVMSGVPHERIGKVIRCWQHDPVEKRFQQLSSQANKTANKLNKTNFVIESNHNYLHLDNSVWSSFWSAMTHAVNNAVDHGLESEPERLAANKEPLGKLVLSANQSEEFIVISIEDDGRGISWDKLKEKADKLGLPTNTHQQMVDVLFYDGISCKEEVSMVSGRGIGMAALKAVVQEMGGEIEVRSQQGLGTCMTFKIPANAVTSRGVKLVCHHFLFMEHL